MRTRKPKNSTFYSALEIGRDAAIAATAKGYTPYDVALAVLGAIRANGIGFRITDRDAFTAWERTHTPVHYVREFPAKPDNLAPMDRPGDRAGGYRND